MSDLDDMGEALERECFTPEMRAEAERAQAQLEAIRHERLVREMREEELRDAHWLPPQHGKFMAPKHWDPDEHDRERG